MRFADERGELSLIGLLVATVIFGIVLSATLGAFDVFGRNIRDSQIRTEATDRARNATDVMARQMRNLATPTAVQPNAVALASPYDMVFETVAPTGTPTAANPQNVQFVRYCLDGSGRKLWAMEIAATSVTASTVAPTSGGCPSAAWSKARVVAQDIVNSYNGADRPVFSFDSETPNAIRRVRVDLFVDTEPGRGSLEQQVTTGVNLRNQDRPPTAAFGISFSTGGVVVLDGSASSDPDNDPLTYCWYDAMASTTVGTCGAHSIGESPYFRYRTTPGTDHIITLTVADPSGLPSTLTKPQFTSQ
jgi:type II secretory pathway pseudopilin PulG